MKNITKLNINNDTIYIKKSVLGYRIIYPVLDPETRKVNKFNLITGGWDNLLFILFIILLTFSFYYVYWNDTHEMQKVLEDPCNYCGTENMKKVLIMRTQENGMGNLLYQDYNLTNINNGGEQE